MHSLCSMFFLTCPIGWCGQANLNTMRHWKVCVFVCICFVEGGGLLGLFSTDQVDKAWLVLTNRFERTGRPLAGFFNQWKWARHTDFHSFLVLVQFTFRQAISYNSQTTVESFTEVDASGQTSTVGECKGHIFVWIQRSNAKACVQQKAWKRSKCFKCCL